MGLAAKALLILALGAQPAMEFRAQPARPPDHTGFAVRYNPGVMERVARNRGIPPQACMVAWTYARAADIGRTWLRIAGPAGAIECLVVDLPQDRDRPGLIKRGVVVELGYRNRWICGAHWSGRARDCKVRVWVLPE